MSLPDSEGQNNLHIDTPAQTISSCGNQLKACDPAEEDTPRRLTDMSSDEVHCGSEYNMIEKIAIYSSKNWDKDLSDTKRSSSNDETKIKNQQVLIPVDEIGNSIRSYTPVCTLNHLDNQQSTIGSSSGYIQVSTSISSANSSYASINEDPPYSLDSYDMRESKVKSTSVSNVSRPVLLAPLNDRTANNIAIYDEDDDNQDLVQQERSRRSSKRAMSLSLDEKGKSKARMSIDGLRSKISPGKFTDSIGLDTHKYGEFHVFDDQYHTFINHPFVPSLRHVKLFSNDEAIFYLLNFQNTKLPEVETMFPWLHGIHRENFGQINFLSSSSNVIEGNNNNRKVITFDKPTLINQIRQESIFIKRSEGEVQEEEEDPISRLTNTPDARFLMPIRSSNLLGEVSSTYSNVIVESSGLIKGSVSIEDVLVNYSSVSNLECYLLKNLPKAIFKDYSLETIVLDCIITRVLPVFKKLDPELGINLRNFHIQVSKISHISDFIVYCFNKGDHQICMDRKREDSFENNKCKCLSIARLLHVAQIVYQHEHPEILRGYNMGTLLNDKKYNTFILENPNIEKLSEYDLISIEPLKVDASSKRDDELCSKYDLNVFNNWDSNYLYRERLEISKMSTATPLPDDVWLGNITDYECLKIQLNNNKDIKMSTKIDVNRILEEQRNNPLFCSPTNTITNLRKIDFYEGLRNDEYDKLLITFPRTIWRFYIKCVENAKIPTLEQLRLIYNNFQDCDFINIEFPPSGSITMADMSDEEILSIINICKFLYYITNSEFPGLIYCSDGYTESSLLTLCYLMYSLNICLDEAILKLHVRYGRPFFIFKTDYVLLSKLETIINKFSPLQTNMQETRDDFTFEDDTRSIRVLLLLMPKKKRSVGTACSVGSVGSIGHESNSFVTNTGHHVVQLRGKPKRHNITHANNFTKFGTKNPNVLKCKPSIDGSFEEVSGSLPSKILGHMYLGSLTHASSIPMLSRLGIEYIVSVGETIPWNNEFKHEKIESSDPHLEKYIYEDSQYDEKSQYFFPIKKVMVLHNINDDGMGTLISTLDETIKFIDECYQKGKKVLVHCQVGVSRSASVCIAEVMSRLKLTLARAYMFVRVRRLNVIIQPNLKLMYELFKWEESNRLKNKDDAVITNSARSLREVEWYVLCREIYNLNRAYIK